MYRRRLLVFVFGAVLIISQARSSGAHNETPLNTDEAVDEQPAVQAYQESTIDQSKASPAGAYGVMQIKPSTAEGSPINIKDIDTNMENNINAGVKYMNYIVNTNFKDAKFDKLNRELFAFAAYNAGPGRVSSLRKKAEAQGLNPDIWFNNVELVAAKEIGSETVTYVSNIYKYYIAYKLVAEDINKKKKSGT